MLAGNGEPKTSRSGPDWTRLYAAAAHLICFPGDGKGEADDRGMGETGEELGESDEGDYDDAELDDEMERFLHGIGDAASPFTEGEPSGGLFAGIPLLEGFNVGGKVITSTVERGADQPPQPQVPKVKPSVCTAPSSKPEPSVTPKEVVSQLEQLLSFYSKGKDFGRVLAYRRAIGEILSWREPITESLLESKGERIGPKIKEKILETLHSGVIQKVTQIEHGLGEEASTQAMFGKIWGVGEAFAAKLYAAGFRTIADLRAKPDMLNKNQKIGLKYYEDLLQKVGREEIGQILTSIETLLGQKFQDEWPYYRMMCCGSYRRGRQLCGDIDILLWREDSGNYEDFLYRVVKTLQGSGLLKETLTLSHELTSKGSITFMGICTLGEGKPHRRIDIKVGDGITCRSTRKYLLGLRCCISQGPNCSTEVCDC